MYSFCYHALIFSFQDSYCICVGSSTLVFYIWNLLLNPFHLFLHFFLIFKAFLFSIFILLKALSVVFFHSCVSSSLIFISEMLFISNSLLSSLASFLNFVILVYVAFPYLVLYTSFSIFGILLFTYFVAISFRHIFIIYRDVILPILLIILYGIFCCSVLHEISFP